MHQVSPLSCKPWHKGTLLNNSIHKCALCADSEKEGIHSICAQGTACSSGPADGATSASSRTEDVSRVARTRHQHDLEHCSLKDEMMHGEGMLCWTDDFGVCRYKDCAHES